MRSSERSTGRPPPPALPEAVKPQLRHLGGFRWEGIALEAYKPEDDSFRDVARQVLFRSGAGELRYFELAPGGWTTLERHAHVHQVMVLRGAGRGLVGGEIFELSKFDLVRVPPLTWHQFRAGSDAPLGFLCLVDRERDRPLRPAPEDLEALCADPEVAAFIRI